MALSQPNFPLSNVIGKTVSFFGNDEQALSPIVVRCDKTGRPLYRDLESGQFQIGDRCAFLSVSIPHTRTMIDAIAVLYSFLPYFMCGSICAWYLSTGSTLPFIALILCVLLSLMSETLLKQCFKQPRPLNSAVRSYGMPSSHSMTAISLWTWIGIEIVNSSNIVVWQKFLLIALISFLLLPILWG
eukprot:GHVL01001145.1.p1 GENE.GHVL01001145.1~~GHVL01001145.1.p1  ORF type:complete len:186 (+),score=4.45 GHVL01001145.1:109-666(+)